MFVCECNQVDGAENRGNQPMITTNVCLCVEGGACGACVRGVACGDCDRQQVCVTGWQVEREQPLLWTTGWSRVCMAGCGLELMLSTASLVQGIVTCQHLRSNSYR